MVAHTIPAMAPNPGPKETPMIRFLLMAVTCGACCHLTAADEQKLTVDQLPAAVKATLLREAHGAALADIEKETEAGKTVYTAEIPGPKPKTVIEFTVGVDGTLLKTETEDDDSDQDGHDAQGDHQGH